MNLQLQELDQQNTRYSVRWVDVCGARNVRYCPQLHFHRKWTETSISFLDNGIPIMRKSDNQYEMPIM
jgi:hypothetical protein